MPRVTDDHLAARRRQILDGARRCFAEYGYDKATVRRLEQTIGLSRGAIFHHFRDKDTLFFELAREDAERMADGFGLVRPRVLVRQPEPDGKEPQRGAENQDGCQPALCRWRRGKHPPRL